MTVPVHPGTIVYVDGMTNQVVNTRNAAELPESARFAPDAQGRLVPIVKVVAFTVGKQRTIREEGPDGTVLRSTVQFAR